MKSDRELLELAAKAVGIELVDKIGAHFIVNDYLSHGFGTSRPWNPLENDGDALRLAFALGMQLNLEECNDINDVRTDIVMAAAEIGASMP